MLNLTQYQYNYNLIVSWKLFITVILIITYLLIFVNWLNRPKHKSYQL